MEMKIMVMATSVGIPHTPIGISLGSAVYIGMRHNKKSHTYVYGIPQGPSIGKVESFVYGTAITKWFDLSDKQHITNIADLSGYTGAVSLKQSGIFKADVKFELYNKKGEEIGSLAKINVPCEKVALPHEFESRNIIRAMPEVKDF